MNFLNKCGIQSGANGTADFTVASAKDGFYIPTQCVPAAVDGETYHYTAESLDKEQHEEGDGVWNEATSTLVRTTVRNSSAGGAKVAFTLAPEVIIGGPIAEDMGSGATTSDVLNVTGDSSSGTVTIESLRGIRQVNITAPTADFYDIEINENPLPGQAVEFILTEASDTGAEAGFSQTVYVNTANVDVVLSGDPVGDGNSVCMWVMESGDWQVVSQNCRIVVDQFMTIQRATLSGVDSLTARPNEGDLITPYFPRVFLSSSSGGAVNVSFDTSNVFNPTFIAFQQADPGDSFVVNPAQFRNLDGSTPSDITFDTDGQCMSIFVYDNSAFVIVSASPGVVTP